MKPKRGRFYGNYKTLLYIATGKYRAYTILIIISFFPLKFAVSPCCPPPQHTPPHILPQPLKMSPKGNSPLRACSFPFPRYNAFYFCIAHVSFFTFTWYHKLGCYFPEDRNYLSHLCILKAQRNVRHLKKGSLSSFLMSHRH